MVNWRLTKPTEGNQGHKKGCGYCVILFPIWLYCDNTSGNQSKKWNTHNLFLFTAAGLPCLELQKEYNVHFLCMSNLAQPLEMLDGIVEQLECIYLLFPELLVAHLYSSKCQKDRIWA